MPVKHSPKGQPKPKQKDHGDKTNVSTAAELQCKACSKPESHDNMVACDFCKLWYHFCCAGVDATVKTKLWLCPDCELTVSKGWRKKAKKQIRLNGTIGRIEITQVDEKRLDDDDAESLGSGVSFLSEHDDDSLTQEEIDEELALIRRERELLALKRARKRAGTAAKASDDKPRPDDSLLKPFRPKRIDRPAAQSTMRDRNDNNSMASMVQLATRQTMCRDLPTFSGKASEWPVFFSSYKTSTEAGQLSDDYNLLRLQKALTGQARKMVEARLIMPNCVSEIMTDLKDYFGRPEFIVEDQLAELRKVPSPSATDLVTIVHYSAAVANVVATLRQGELADHFNNPMLLKELVEKLPATQKLEWANYRKKLQHVGVDVFSDWLRDHAMNICSVVRVAPASEDGSKESDGKRTKNEKFVGAHIEDSDHTVSRASNQQAKCPICGDERHRVAVYCKKFCQMSLKQKHDVIRKCFICRLCLRKHKPYCDLSGAECGINGCKQAHHPLLHRYATSTDSGKTTLVQANAETTSATPASSNPVSTTSANASMGPANATVASVENTTSVVSTRNANAMGAGTHPYSSNRPACDQSLQMSHRTVSSDILCRIIPVLVGGAGKEVETFAFLDNGSTVTMVEEQLLKSLGVTGNVRPLYLNWTGGTSRTEETSMQVELTVKGIHDGAQIHKLKARSVRSLGLPSQTLDAEKLKAECATLRNIPISSYTNAKPMLLIGLDNWVLAVARNIRTGAEDQPTASKCRLGWSVEGIWVGEEQEKREDVCNVHACSLKDVSDNKVLLSNSLSHVNDDSSKARAVVPIKRMVKLMSLEPKVIGRVTWML